MGNCKGNYCYFRLLFITTDVMGSGADGSVGLTTVFDFSFPFKIYSAQYTLSRSHTDTHTHTLTE